MSYLTFKRGTYADLENTNLTSNMLYVATDEDNKGIYFDYVDTDDNDIIKRAKFTSQTVYDNQYITNNLCAINKIVDGNISFQNKTNIGCGYVQQAIGDVSSLSNIIEDSNTLSSAIRYVNDSPVSIKPLWVNTDPITTSYTFGERDITIDTTGIHTIIFKTIHASTSLTLQNQSELRGTSNIDSLSSFEIGYDGTHYRQIDMSNGTVHFNEVDNGYGDNHYIIPMAIYGVTGLLPLGNIGGY